MPQLVAEEVTHFLKQTSLFAILDDESVERLAKRTTMQRFSLGETIIEEGGEGRFAYLIFSGRVRALKRSDSGRQVALGTQTVGEIFGEQAILTDSPRSASVRASEDVVLFRIDRVDFLDLLNTSERLRRYFDQFIHERSVRDFLRTQTFLEKLKARDVTSLLDQLETCEFPVGEVVVREGASADVMYIVREGALKVVRETDHGELILGRLSDGDFFGERALLTDEPRSASVITETETRCFALSRKHFDRLLETSPAIREQLTERFSHYDAANELLAADQKSAAGLSTDETRGANEAASVLSEKDSEESATPSTIEASPDVSTRRRHQTLRTGPRWFEPLPWIAQQDESDCGAASLAMVARYFGIRIPVAKLRRLADTGYAGASLYALASAASQVGFKPQAIRLTVEQLATTRLPAIVHWENRHYLVLYRSDHAGAEFVIGDPARGLLKLTRQQFEEGWSGRLLSLEPTLRLEEVPRPRSFFESWTLAIRNRIPAGLKKNEAQQALLLSSAGEGAGGASGENIRLENASYRFSPDGPEVLSGINLEIQAGQTVAIVGRNGAGKTLLSNVITGMVSSADCQLLRERDLFDGLTIAENIAFGSGVAPDNRDAVVSAAVLAEADPFIKSLPYGYDTPVGNGFARLSAGEGQLISLARAALLDASLIVMDDTFSALNADQIRRILLRLRNHSLQDAENTEARKRTFVVTSRSVAAIRDADLIAVLDDGHLVEAGRHQDLIAQEGLYSFLSRERSV